MANEKVSQLVEIIATEIAPADLFFIGDVSVNESKKLQASSLITFVNASASINAAHANFADTASYVQGSNVYGSVANAANAVSASHALKSNETVTSSYSITASYVVTTGTSVVTADTASFLKYSGVPNGTSSYSLTSSLVNYALTASSLLYIPGTSVNTASYALSASVSNLSNTASFISTASYSYTSSVSMTSSFSLNGVSSSYAISASSLIGYFSPILARCSISWSLGIQYPQILSSQNIRPQLGNGLEFGGGITPLGSYLYSSATTSLFGVSFQTPLSNNRYGFMGSGNTYMDPTIAIPTVNGFTMSVITTSPTFYNTLPSNRLWYQALGFTQFQIFE